VRESLKTGTGAEFDSARTVEFPDRSERTPEEVNELPSEFTGEVVTGAFSPEVVFLVGL
jgi:hypothetical protein